MNIPLILSVIELASVLATVIFIFLGIQKTVKHLKKDSRETQIPKDILFKSTRLIVIGILFFAVFRFTSNLLNMPDGEEVPLLVNAGSSLLQTAYMIGFTAFIPTVLNRMRSAGARNRED
jgi:putative Mn2+ efflux pump MntP